MRGQYDHHKAVKAAQGIKIAAHGLENAVAGTQLLVVGPGDDVDALKEEVMEDMQDIFASVDRSGESGDFLHPLYQTCRSSGLTPARSPRRKQC